MAKANENSPSYIHYLVQSYHFKQETTIKSNFTLVLISYMNCS